MWNVYTSIQSHTHTCVTITALLKEFSLLAGSARLLFCLRDVKPEVLQALNEDDDDDDVFLLHDGEEFPIGLQLSDWSELYASMLK